MKRLVMVPTYNEVENVGALIAAIRSLKIDTDILVIDDNSPDGTGALVEKLMNSDSRLYILKRQKKEGLGRAYVAGFHWGLDRNYQLLIEMDADFSHRPEDLKKMIETIGDADAALGSRYVRGGSTVNWGFGRKILSRGGSVYATLMLWKNIKDWTGGFNAWRDHVLRAIGVDNIQSNGYAFQIELKYRAIKKGFRLVEVPIVFEDRRVGKSKMSGAIVREGITRLWSIRRNA